MKFKNRKLLFYMEVRFRLMKIYSRRINRMILGGDSLCSARLVRCNKKHEKHLWNLYGMKERFE